MSIIFQPCANVNKDLVKEREKCTFNTQELTHLLNGGVERTRKRKELENMLFNEPKLVGGTPLEYLSHKEKYEQLAEKTSVFVQKIREYGIDKMQEYLPMPMYLEYGIFSDAMPLDTHYGMFVSIIASQGNKEQQEKWLPKAMNCNIIGTYAQTELGHGTFIRGLETTATYAPETQEFILNSPTLTSYKWWPAALGNTANYAIVLAQLYTLEKSHGIHPFIVQLRDEETHIPLPGIKIGDIGPRFGMSGANNGYLGFDHLRIPRENMLMGNSKILPNGKYIESVSKKLTYGTMVSVRVMLVAMAADFIKISSTIAVRYSAVRRQSQMKAGEPECQIIDYLTQQYKLFPIVATAFAFHYTSASLKNVYDQVKLELQDGNLNRLPELHALSSCLKAVATKDATTAVETCRLACGGHGYLMSSSFPKLYGVVTPMCTYDGENTVLLLQTARFLIKAWSHVIQGKSLAPSVSYLKVAKDFKEKPFTKATDWVISALELISARKVELAWQNIDTKVRKGLTPEEAWNLTSIELVQAAEIYARTFIIKTFMETVLAASNTSSQPVTLVLHQLLELYSVYVILTLQGELLRFTDVTGEVIGILQNWLVELLATIRQNAVSIVDSFDLPDEALVSTLGAYDGNVYERLYKEALKSPLNEESVNRTFNLYLKPFLKAKC